MPYEFLQYLFVEQLGRGGMGAVFRAYDKRAPERPWVAVKVAQLHGTDEDRAIKERAFAREVRAAAALSEYNKFFVGFRAADFNGKPAYLALDYIDWPTLRKLKGEVGSFSPVDVARIGVAILRGVRWMERKNIVHRDLKPANIFARRSNDGTFEAKIADLGIWVEAGTMEDSLVGVTDMAHIVGSPAYMSPEQTRGGALTIASDIHAVGSILWELATGAPPYPINRAIAIAEAIQERHERMRTAPPRPPSMPLDLYWLLSSALHFDPNKRIFADGDVSHSAETSVARWMEKSLDKFVSDYIEEQRKALEDALDHLGGIDRRIASIEASLTPAILLADRAKRLRARVNGLQANKVESNLPDAVKALASEVEQMVKESAYPDGRDLRPSLVRPHDATPEQITLRDRTPPEQAPANAEDALGAPEIGAGLRSPNDTLPLRRQPLLAALVAGVLVGLLSAYLFAILPAKPIVPHAVGAPPSTASADVADPAGGVGLPGSSATASLTSLSSAVPASTATANVVTDSPGNTATAQDRQPVPTAMPLAPTQASGPSNRLAGNCGCAIGDIMCAGRCYEKQQAAVNETPYDESESRGVANKTPPANEDIY